MPSCPGIPCVAIGHCLGKNAIALAKILACCVRRMAAFGGWVVIVLSASGLVVPISFGRTRPLPMIPLPMMSLPWYRSRSCQLSKDHGKPCCERVGISLVVAAWLLRQWRQQLANAPSDNRNACQCACVAISACDVLACTVKLPLKPLHWPEPCAQWLNEPGIPIETAFAITACVWIFLQYETVAKKLQIHRQYWPALFRICLAWSLEPMADDATNQKN